MDGRWLVIAAVIAVSGRAIADDRHHHKPTDPKPNTAPKDVPAPEPSPPVDDTPWSKGVSAEQKAAAEKLLEAGNDLFVQNKHHEALAKYQEAVASWDHPSIRFNMVRALIALDRPLEAYESLEKALAYGKGPLEDHVFDEAQNYLRLLEGQIATLEISCKQTGVTISVNGAVFLTCPGAKSVRTTPGNHAIVGAKEGFLTKTLDTMLLPGNKKPIEVSLVSLQAATVTRTRWATWKPWAVSAGGAIIAGIGVVLQFKASHWLGVYDQGVQTQCPGKGCTAEQLGPLADDRSRGLLENKVAIGTMVVGGAAVITGLTLVIMNRPKTFMPERQPVVTPLVGNGTAGVMLSGRF